MTFNKVYPSSAAALEGLLHNDMTIMSGGFGICGIPENLIRVILESGVHNLTIISNTCGVEDFGLGLLLRSGQIKKVVASYVGDNKVFERLLLENKILLELSPQGTLSERIRAGGAGIPAFYTKTGVGTIVEEGKEVREFDGIKYLMEKCLKADLSIIKGYKADTSGNIIYRKTARNFNPMMAAAGKVTVCEVEHVTPIGELDPDCIHTPSIYVDRIVLGEKYERRIEKLATIPHNTQQTK